MDSFDKTLKECVYAVEATYFEALTLWDRTKRLHNVDIAASPRTSTGKMKTLCQLNIDGETMPLTLNLSIREYKGFFFCFYASQSQVVDHRLVEMYIDAHFPQRTDAMNFHRVIHHIENLIKIGTAPPNIV